MNTNRPRSSQILIMVLASVLGALPSMNQAEVTLDGTLGPSGALPGPDFVISEDLGQIRGGNLFHSFGFFNINTGESATFTGPSSVANILGRVTGGQQSFIDGPLRSQIPGANLYLMNPSGLLFGPNSTLDVSGSFHVTTADYIGLGDGGRFDASNPAESVLTMAPPAAFGFLGDSPAAIAMVQSRLEVPNGERLAIVGGQTVIAGSALTAASGRIEIASVSSAGEVIPADSGLQMRGVENQGNIYLFGGSSVSTSGPSSGQIVIRGGRFEVDNASVESTAMISGNGGGVDIEVPGGDVIVTNDGSLKTDSFGTASGLKLEVDAQNIVLSEGGFIAARAGGDHRGGDIHLTARESVSISGIGPSGFASGILAGSFDLGDGGRLTISSPELTLSDDGEIFSFSAQSGRGSDVVLNVDKLTLETGGNIDVSSFSAGSGGNLDISAEDAIRIAGGGQLQLRAFAQGDSGRLALATSGLLSITDAGFINSESVEGATGSGADLGISVDRLEITEGGFIAANTFGAGKGGNLEVSAGSGVSISGNAGQNRISGLYAQAQGGGDGGSLSVTAPDLALSEGGTINSDTSFGGGAGADISVSVGRLTIDGGLDAELGGTSIRSTTRGRGQGGNINITASQQITLDGQSGPLGASIAGDSLAAGTGTGPAGHITLTTPALRLLRHATISGSTAGDGAAGNINLIVGKFEIAGGLVDTSTFGAGQAGHINISTTDSLTLVGLPDGATDFDKIGQISSLTGSSGDAGAITIFSPVLVVDSGGRISTEVRGAGGVGGHIQIEGGHVQLINGGFISAASTGTGLAGNVTVHAKDASLLENSRVITETIQSDGGDIMFNVGDTLYLLESKITTSVSGGAGNGGNITIDPQFVILNRSDITANAFGGDGGNILIVADNFLASSDSNITASSRFGLAGQVVIRSPEDDAIAGVAVLPESFLDAAAQLSERCVARANAKISSFVLLGRGGIPATPNSLQLSSYVDVQNDRQRNDSHNEEVLQQSQLSLRTANETGTWSVPSLLLLECGRPDIREPSNET